tara:strand:- start:43 stop:180 length:138 start_codon:yes stop_codon:yes gene_type:complete
VVDKYYSSADNVGWKIYGSTPLNELDMGQAKALIILRVTCFFNCW